MFVLECKAFPGVSGIFRSVPPRHTDVFVRIGTNLTRAVLRFYNDGNGNDVCTLAYGDSMSTFSVGGAIDGHPSNFGRRLCTNRVTREVVVMFFRKVGEPMPDNVDWNTGATFPVEAPKRSLEDQNLDPSGSKKPRTSLAQASGGDGGSGGSGGSGGCGGCGGSGGDGGTYTGMFPRAPAGFVPKRSPDEAQAVEPSVGVLIDLTEDSSDSETHVFVDLTGGSGGK